VSQSSPTQPNERPYRYDLNTPLKTRYPRTRPTGVTILAVLNFIGAGLQLLALLLLIFVPPPTVFTEGVGNDPTGFGTMLQRIQEEQLATQRMITGCVALFVAPLSLATGIGLWRLRPWARKLSLVLYGLAVILTLLTGYSRALTGSSLISIAVSVAAFVYLLRPEVAAAFTERADV
jgi:hypothetical protein